MSSQPKPYKRIEDNDDSPEQLDGDILDPRCAMLPRVFKGVVIARVPRPIAAR